jgi:hypothetical protein
MMWYKCIGIMPGEIHDARKHPEEKISRFLICYHRGDKNLINPDLKVAEAILVDGKFLCEGRTADWEDAIITHWMLIELP